jgi:hypothetical protein
MNRKRKWLRSLFSGAENMTRSFHNSSRYQPASAGLLPVPNGVRIYVATQVLGVLFFYFSARSATCWIIQTSHQVASAIYTGRKARLFPRVQLQHSDGILGLRSCLILFADSSAGPLKSHLHRKGDQDHKEPIVTGRNTGIGVIHPYTITCVPWWFWRRRALL